MSEKGEFICAECVGVSNLNTRDVERMTNNVLNEVGWVVNIRGRPELRWKDWGIVNVI